MSFLNGNVPEKAEEALDLIREIHAEYKAQSLLVQSLVEMSRAQTEMAKVQTEILEKLLGPTGRDEKAMKFDGKVV